MNQIDFLNRLKKDWQYHRKEIIKHRELEKQTKSKNQRAKRMRHFHQKGYIQDLLKDFGYTVCKECGGLKNE